MIRNYKTYLEKILENKQENDNSPEYKERAWKKFRRAIMTIVNKYGFFADLLFNMKVLMTYEVETMATDGTYILWNPRFVIEELEQDEVVFVICHELMHCMLMHMSRRGIKDPLIWNYAGDYAINILLKNDSGDVNEQVGTMPKEALWEKKYQYMSADQIYDILVKENPPQQGGGSGQGQQGEGQGQGSGGQGSSGDGSGEGSGSGQGTCPHCGKETGGSQGGDGAQGDGAQGGGDAQGGGAQGDGAQGDSSQGGDGTCPHCGGDMNDGSGDYKGEGGADVKAERVKRGIGTKTGDVLDSGDLKDIAERAKKDQSNIDGPGKIFVSDELEQTNDIEKSWSDITQVSAQKNQGSGIADIDRVIRKMQKPKVNWKSQLKSFVAKIYNKRRYRIPNRRNIHKGEYLWGSHKQPSDYKDVIIAVDTSGSIGESELNQFGSEIESIAQEKGIQNLYVVYCDAGIPKDGIQLFKKGDDFKIEKMRPKGGGGTSFYPPFEWIYKNVPNPAFVVYFTDSYGDAPKSKDKIVSSYKDRVMWVITVAESAPHIKFGKKLFVDKDDFKS